MTAPKPPFDISNGIMPSAEAGAVTTVIPKLGAAETISRYGISDITAQVDARSKAVLAAEEFAACQYRVEMLRGQLKAEIERFQELGQQLKDLTTEAIVKELEPR